jgi:hypothetical protein
MMRRKALSDADKAAAATLMLIYLLIAFGILIAFAC